MGADYVYTIIPHFNSYFIAIVALAMLLQKMLVICVFY